MNFIVLLSFIGYAVVIVSCTNVESATLTHRILSAIVERKVFDLIGFQNLKDYKALPADDAIIFEAQHFDLCGPIMCISANLTNGALTGLAGYDVLKLDFNSNGGKVTIDIDIIFRALQLNAEYYEMEGNIMNAVPLAGKGKLLFEITDLRFWTKTILQVSDHTSIESFENSGFSIKSILSHTEFDCNIDGIFNALVMEVLTDYLNRFNKAIATSCGTILKDILNPILD